LGLITLSSRIMTMNDIIVMENAIIRNVKLKLLSANAESEIRKLKMA